MTTSAATIFATSDRPLGNGAFAADGRLVVSHHPMYETAERVSFLGADGRLSPFPNLAWNTPSSDPQAYLDAVLGLRTDSHGRIWLADMGTRSGIQAKFVVWDTRIDALWRVIPLPASATTEFSEPNDFVIDERRGKLYIADEAAGGGGDGSRAALIVLDIASGAAVRRLEGFDGIRAEDRTLAIDGVAIERNDPSGERTPLRVGVDGIAMDGVGEWLYLSPLNGHSLWRLRADDLLDNTLDDFALAERMERYADKPNSGGMCIDAHGNLYLTVMEKCAIGRIAAADRTYSEPLVRADMYWPDGIMEGPDGALYVVTTQLPRSPALARPGEMPVRPFKIFRWDPHESQSEVSELSRALRGAAAGLLAASALKILDSAWQRYGGADHDPPPTEILAQRIHDVAAAGALDPKSRQLAGDAIHFATGAAFGAAYTLLAERSRTITRGHGTAFGLAVWAGLEEVGLSTLRLAPKPSQRSMSKHLFGIVAHIAFGAILHRAGKRLGAIDEHGESPAKQP